MFQKQKVYLFGSRKLLTVCVLCLTFYIPLFAQTEHSWKVVSSGGTNATSGTLKLRGTVGQTAAAVSTSGTLNLNAGFWQDFGASSGCCIGIKGDFNGDGRENTLLDLNFLVNDIFRTGPSALCPEETDINGDGRLATLLDLNFLVNDIFRTGPSPGPCAANLASIAPLQPPSGEKKD